MGTSSREIITTRKERALWSTNRMSSEPPKTANLAPQKKANGKGKTIRDSNTTIFSKKMRMTRSKSTSLISKTIITRSKTTKRCNKTSKMATKGTRKVKACKKTMLARSAETQLRKTNMPSIGPIKSDSLSTTLSSACLARTCAQCRDVSSCSIKTGGSSRKKTSLSKSPSL